MKWGDSEKYAKLHDLVSPLVENFYDETDGYYFAQEQQYRHDEILFGYYEDEENTYLAFFFMEQDENGDLILSRDTLILNTETGEFSVSEWIV